MQVSDYSAYFAEAQHQTFNTMALTVDDPVVKGAALSFIRDFRDKEGKKAQVVLADYHQADYEGVISVKNGVIQMCIRDSVKHYRITTRLKDHSKSP